MASKTRISVPDYTQVDWRELRIFCCWESWSSCWEMVVTGTIWSIKCSNFRFVEVVHLRPCPSDFWSSSLRCLTVTPVKWCRCNIDFWNWFCTGDTSRAVQAVLNNSVVSVANTLNGEPSSISSSSLPIDFLKHDQRKLITGTHYNF